MGRLAVPVHLRCEPPSRSLVTVALLAAAGALFGQGAYLWVKAAHVIAVISWMAGMLYLPRLFIYHCDAPARICSSPRPSRSWRSGS